MEGPGRTPGSGERAGATAWFQVIPEQDPLSPSHHRLRGAAFGPFPSLECPRGHCVPHSWVPPASMVLS